ncbi:MAG TPA: hypothetical protein VGF21_00435 [Thermoleophilaceae bacterium]
MDVVLVIAVASGLLALVGRFLMAAAAKGERSAKRSEPRRLRLTTIERRPGRGARTHSRVLN